MADRLDVHLYGRHVAHIDDNGDGLASLTYTPTALRVGPPARLSVSLPPRDATYPSLRGAIRWIRALLPEGSALDAVARTLRIPVDDTFGLLAATGRDVAGAAIIVPAGEPPASPDAAYRTLDDAALADLIERLPQQPLGIDRDRGVRLSLAGLQDKLLLHRPARSRHLQQPLHGAPSSLICKPDPGTGPLAGLATAELYGLRLARAAGLDTADATLRMIGDRPCLLIDRYDRRRRPDGLHRIHQEDLLTALGRDPTATYEHPDDHTAPAIGGFATAEPLRGEPGPALADLADLVARHVAPAATLTLLAATTYNVLLGNADAHARNTSLLLDEDGTTRLAPLYDLVPTRLYPHLDTTTAQRIGGGDDLDHLTRDHLRDESSRWGLPDRTATRTIDRTLDRALERCEQVARHAAGQGADPDVLDALVALTRRRHQQLTG